METTVIFGIIVGTFVIATPIMVTAIGGLYSERSGVTNIALEGIMVIGAFTAAVTSYMLSNSLGEMSVWVALIAGAVAGLVYSIIHAVASITFKADQIISGTALNMLAVALTVYLCQIIFGQERSANIAFKPVKIMLFGKIGLYPTTFIAIAIIIITSFVIFRTRFGLRLRACGEFPQAAASAGISVTKMRYIGVLLSGLLGGLGGAMLVMTNDIQFTAVTVSGLGFIALAALIFGRWNPIGVLFSSIFFGFAKALSLYTNNIPGLEKLPKEVFFMLPYVLTILALVVFSVRGGYSGPKAAGEIYDEGKR